MSGNLDPTVILPSTASPTPSNQAGQRISLTIAGTVFTSVLEVTVSRDLRDIAGKFDVTLFNPGSAQAAASGSASPFLVVQPGQACQIAIDGTVVLVGSIDEIEIQEDGTSESCKIAGRDKCGDLVDCAAAPMGPAEFKGVDLLSVATTICAPFGIYVAAQTNLGSAFVRLALSAQDTSMGFLDSAAKQRSTLLVSDGVGGLLLTAGGFEQAPGPLVRGQNILKSSTKQSWTQRFSDYYVKGQTDSSGYVTNDAPLTLSSNPGTLAATDGTQKTTILMTGHATDPAVGRWRPTVRLTRSQSGMATTQVQAEWAARLALGESYELNYTVLDYRAGTAKALWRPNQQVQVTDPRSGIDDVMLIAGVTYRYSTAGEFTDLRVVGINAYDRTNQASRRRPGSKASTGQTPDVDLSDLEAP